MTPSLHSQQGRRSEQDRGAQSLGRVSGLIYVLSVTKFQKNPKLRSCPRFIQDQNVSGQYRTEAWPYYLIFLLPQFPCVSNKDDMPTSQHSKDRMKFSGKVLCSWPSSEQLLMVLIQVLVAQHPSPGPGLPQQSHPQISGREWGISFGASSCPAKWPSGSRQIQLYKPLFKEQFWVLLLRSQQVSFAFSATIFFKAGFQRSNYCSNCDEDPCSLQPSMGSAASVILFISFSALPNTFSIFTLIEGLRRLQRQGQANTG